MDYKSDKRSILTLDAGGTNFDFSAVKGGEMISKGVRLPAIADSLDDILKMIIKGFDEVGKQADEKPAAISFCFPGPADFGNGIIGDLENLPLFRGGVALKAMLENYFAVPVFINNDGDLFAYGEAIAGLLPEVNKTLGNADIQRRYRNILGVTFGTGFGSGMVCDGQLFTGDNSAAFEINRMRNKLYPHTSAEDSVTIRAIKRVYAREAGLSPEDTPEPEAIYKIGVGEIGGNGEAAKIAFDELAEVAGCALADAVTLTDSLIVIGGGLAGAWPLFMPRLVEEMNAAFTEISGEKLPRLEISSFNLEEENELKNFMADSSRQIKVPFSEKIIDYNPVKKIGVGISRLGTSRAVAVGAYTFALNELSNL